MKECIFLNEQKKSNNKIWLAVAALVVAVAVVLGIYFVTRPAPQQGGKTITVQVVLLEGEPSDFTIQTDEEYLRGALESIDLIEGSESEYGLFVTTVNGVTVDDSKQQWWCFTQDGEMLMTGVDTTPIADGDHFEITLTEGYLCQPARWYWRACWVRCWLPARRHFPLYPAWSW